MLDSITTNKSDRLFLEEIKHDGQRILCVSTIECQRCGEELEFVVETNEGIRMQAHSCACHAIH